MYQQLTSKRRNPSSNFLLGCLLALIAGAINAGAFFLVAQYTSHMTGIISLAADSAALGDYFSAALLIGYIACFVMGAIVTAAITLFAKRYHLHSQYALPLALEAIILLCFALCWQESSPSSEVIPFFIATICFVMGLQNALITKASSAIIRTTHITGMTTDLGIEIGRLLVAQKTDIDRTSTIQNAKHHIIIIATFFAGGVIGALGVNAIGTITFMLIALMLALLAYPQLQKDLCFHLKIQKRRRAI